MEIKNVITIDNLTADSVSVKTQRTLVEDNGDETALGLPSRKAYMNNADGRAEIADEVPEPYCSAVLSVWGDNTTVEDDSTDTE